LIINNRVGHSRQGMAGMSASKDAPGDFGTPEQQVPANGLPGVDWETCMTLNDTWGFQSFDDGWKDTKTLVQTLVDVASKGGNLLLNVGPTAQGVIPPQRVTPLRIHRRATPADRFVHPAPGGLCRKHLARSTSPRRDS